MRPLHTMLRVGDLQCSIDFYTKALGMKPLRISESPEYKYLLAFAGCGPETEEAVIELTYNWGVDKCEFGIAYGHIALSVDNAVETCEKIRQDGDNVIRETDPVKGGTTVIAFVEDPDGYKIELIEEKDAGRGLGNQSPAGYELIAPVSLLHRQVIFVMIRTAIYPYQENRMSDNAQLTGLCDRFCDFYPVVIGVGTAGLNAKTDVSLEITAITLKMDEQGWLTPDITLYFHVEPFVDANLQSEALALNGTDPNDPDRGAVSEYEALHEIFKVIRKDIKASGCNRAIMVAHNANFDYSFMVAAAECASLKRDPFHPFATFDTAILAGLVPGQTVLSKACQTADMNFDSTQAHSTLHDTERTAVLPCEIVNRWKRLGGWPLPVAEEV